jgi:hypothetical protein
MPRHELKVLYVVKFNPETRERLGVREAYQVVFYNALSDFNCLISFVLPISRLTPLSIERWGIVIPVKSHRFPRSHPIVILEITDLYLESTEEGGKLEKVIIKLPHEMTSEELVPKSPSGRVHVSGRSGFLRKVKNIKLTFPLKFNEVDVNANKPYLSCSFDLDE